VSRGILEKLRARLMGSWIRANEYAF
jgi:hypothetical protein